MVTWEKVDETRPDLNPRRRVNHEDRNREQQCTDWRPETKNRFAYIE
jgi:hypothetical protein